MKKSPGIAAVLSFVIPGLGFIYCEQILRGIVIFLICGFLDYQILVTPNLGWAIVALIAWIINIITSKSAADDYNK